MEFVIEFLKIEVVEELLRSTISQERLSSLATCTIERAILQTINLIAYITTSHYFTHKPYPPLHRSTLPFPVPGSGDGCSSRSASTSTAAGGCSSRRRSATAAPAGAGQRRHAPTAAQAGKHGRQRWLQQARMGGRLLLQQTQQRRQAPVVTAEASKRGWQRRLH